MLKLSTKSSYGLRACLTLARADKLMSSTEIAEKDDIPKRYLEQILSALRQCGIVESTRGARGGYALTRPPEEITIADLVQSVEGELPPMLCTNPELRSDTCREESNCDCRNLCAELDNSVSRVLTGTTLADIVAQNKSLNTKINGDASHGGTSVPATFASSSSNSKR